MLVTTPADTTHHKTNNTVENPVLLCPSSTVSIYIILSHQNVLLEKQTKILQ